MNYHVKDGEICIPVESLVRDPEVARSVAKNVIFDEMLLTAIVSLALTGECDWGDGSLPWYILNCRTVNFERLRQRIIEVAPDAAKQLAKEATELRDRAQEERGVYQLRAWEAENFVRSYKGWIEDMLKSRFGRRAEELNELARICERPAHAEIGGAS